MELYIAGRDFRKEESIDVFESAIWTERYAGDGDFQLNVEASPTMLSLLPRGQLILCESSAQPMILETREVKEGLLKTTGITLAKWFNNRPFRTAADHNIKEYVSNTRTPGQLLTWLVQNFLISGSYLNGTIPIGLSATDRNRLNIPGLVMGSEAPGGAVFEVVIPFGPLYDILSQIANTYEIGMNVNLDYANDSGYQLSYNSFVGLDRTSSQTDRPSVQFSPDMDTLTNISDLESILDHRNLIETFVSSVDSGVIDTPGRATSVTDVTDGFDLRVHQEFVDLETVSDDTTDPVTHFSEASLVTRLNQRAAELAQELKVVQLVDGEIVPNKHIKYDAQYFLGDIVEIIGNFGGTQPARITEYIRSQDSAGERAYPTLSMID